MFAVDHFMSFFYTYIDLVHLKQTIFIFFELKISWSDLQARELFILYKFYKSSLSGTRPNYNICLPQLTKYIAGMVI